MDERAFKHGARRSVVSAWWRGEKPLRRLDGIGREAAMRQEMDQLPVETIHAGAERIAQSRGTIGNSFEDRLQVGWRTVDDLQHLGSRGLLFERLARLGHQARV